MVKKAKNIVDPSVIMLIDNLGLANYKYFTGLNREMMLESEDEARMIAVKMAKKSARKLKLDLNI